jgi:hypothetical protein
VDTRLRGEYGADAEGGNAIKDRGEAIFAGEELPECGGDGVDELTGIGNESGIGVRLK